MTKYSEIVPSEVQSETFKKGKKKKKNVQKISYVLVYPLKKREVKGKNKMKEKMINPNNS